MDDLQVERVARDAIRPLYRRNETEVVDALLAEAVVPPELATRIRMRAIGLVEGMRVNRRRFGGLDDFLQEFGLSTMKASP